jgi:hypothetical protein
MTCGTFECVLVHTEACTCHLSRMKTIPRHLNVSRRNRFLTSDPVFCRLYIVSKLVQEEFFQRDNYRTLVAVRRSLVSLVEGMYRDTPTTRTNDKTTKRAKAVSAVLDISQPTYLPSNVSPESIEEDGDRRRRKQGPSLRSLLQKVETRNKHKNTTGTAGGRATSVDVTLESALLSLGRCLDLVRPAGLMLAHTSVPKQDWKQALRQLEQFLDLMQSACDPDRPLNPEEWGKVLNTGKSTTEKAESATMYHDTDPRSADLGLTDNDEDDLSKMLSTSMPWQTDSVDKLE